MPFCVFEVDQIRQVVDEDPKLISLALEFILRLSPRLIGEFAGEWR
jgi:hypothetical protein